MTQISLRKLIRPQVAFVVMSLTVVGLNAVIMFSVNVLMGTLKMEDRNFQDQYFGKCRTGKCRPGCYFSSLIMYFHAVVRSIQLDDARATRYSDIIHAHRVAIT